MNSIKTVAMALALFPNTIAAHAHSTASDPGTARLTSEDHAPEGSVSNSQSRIAGAPPQVESVVDQFKLWRTGTTLPACFINGQSDLRDFFVSTAQTWLVLGGFKIDFGERPTYRDCPGNAERGFRIAFGYQKAGRWDTGNWSYVGTDANTAPPGPTINIGYAANTTLDQLDKRELRRLILHELGHAMALEHEHQSPLARCEFDWSKVLPYYKSRYNWDEQTTRFNLGKLAPSPAISATEFDPDSIMNYAFAAWMFVQSGSEACEIRENYEPSRSDLATYAKLYPKTPTGSDAGADPQGLTNAQQQQDKMLAQRAAIAMSQLQKLIDDEASRKKAVELIEQTARREFRNFSINIRDQSVRAGNIVLQTGAPCSPAVVSVGNDFNMSCSVGPSIETQNIGNQLNNNGTINNQGGINFGTQTKP